MMSLVERWLKASKPFLKGGGVSMQNVRIKLSFYK